MSEWATAYHEAGHAVADLMLGNGLRRVTIIPDRDAGSAGSCSAGKYHHKAEHSPEFDTSTRSRLRMERHVKALLAGEEAQRRFSARSIRRHHGRADLRHAVDLVTYFTGSIEEARAYLNLLQIQTRQLVRGLVWWPIITAVAEQLVVRKTLTAKDVRAIRDSCYPAEFAESRERLRMKARRGGR